MRINRISSNCVNFKTRQLTAQENRIFVNGQIMDDVFLYDVDTTNAHMDQHVTIRPDGTRDGFPVKGADRLIPVLAKIKDRAYAVLPKIETVDAHKPSDPELKSFKYISDIHSEKGTKGAEKIPETLFFDKPDELIEVEPEKADVPSLDRIKDIFSWKGVIRLEKNDTSPLRYGDGKTGRVVENRKGIALFENLRRAGVKMALIYGVATDYSVKEATIACKKFGIQPVIIKDAVKEAVSNSLADPNDPVYKDVPVITSDQLPKAR